MSPTASSRKALSTSGQLNMLQYYSVGVGKDVKNPGQVQVWGGLQDNGVSLLDPANKRVMVSPYGGDGGMQLVDPKNGCRTVGEYVQLTLQMTTNCGVADGSPASDSAIITIAPNDPLPRFIAPFSADQTNQNAWVAGGEFVWTNTKTWASTSGADGTKAADTDAGHSITALASRNRIVWAGMVRHLQPLFRLRPRADDQRQRQLPAGGYGLQRAASHGYWGHPGPHRPQERLGRLRRILPQLDRRAGQRPR